MKCNTACMLVLRANNSAFIKINLFLIFLYFSEKHTVKLFYKSERFLWLSYHVYVTDVITTLIWYFFLQNSYTFSRGCIWYMVNVLLFDHPRNKRQHLSCLLFVVFNWHFKDKNIFKRYIRLKLCKMYNLFRMHWVILEITFNWFFYCPIRIVNAPVKKKICIHCLLMSLFFCI